MTTARTYVKIKVDQKIDFLPLPGKLLLALRAMMVYSTRICCFLSFFGPFLGLMGGLAHWTAERISLDATTFNKLNNNAVLPYWDVPTQSEKRVLFHGDDVLLKSGECNWNFV